MFLFMLDLLDLSDISHDVLYLKKPGFLLFVELFLQYIPQPVNYSVAAMVTTIISCVTSVGLKEKVVKINLMNVTSRNVTSRQDDLGEGFPVPHDNFWKYIDSFAPCC